MKGDIDRAAFVVAVAAFSLAPAVARADEKKRFRCLARLERNRDKRVVRQLETVVEDGKSAQVLDGTWNYDRIPRSPRGLLATFTAKDGPKIHLRVDAEFGQAGAESAGGNNVVIVNSKTSVEDDFEPGREIAYPWTINGEDHLLYVSVAPVKPS